MLRRERDIGARSQFFELLMAQPILAFVVFGLAMVHGWLWSVGERRKALQAAYDEIRDEVRRERLSR
jgi:hypothetical protein